MNGTMLRTALFGFVSPEAIRARSEEIGVIQRLRKLDLVALVWALVFAAGSDDSGRQADAYSKYLEEAEHGVVRGSFYNWFNVRLALLMMALVHDALEQVRALPPVLPKELAGREDWILVDSETVILPAELAEAFPATSTPAGLKVHKFFSLGRNNIVDFQISPARDHDAPFLEVDETWRGKGLIVDLGYASKKLIRDCQKHGVSLVIRLKHGWKPHLLRWFHEDGEVFEPQGEPVVDHLLDMPLEESDNVVYDLDVAFGRGSDRVEARLVGVPADDGYHWCITLLPRETYPPALVCLLYRARWEVECDMKRDKAGARLDQVGAEKVESAFTLIFASLLRTIITNHLVYLDLRERPPTRAPLHGLALAFALSVNHPLILLALAEDRPTLWDRAARILRSRGHDPNWRSRPSILDRLRGTTAPRGRPRHSSYANCPADSRSFGA